MRKMITVRGTTYIVVESGVYFAKTNGVHIREVNEYTNKVRYDAGVDPNDGLTWTMTFAIEDHKRVPMHTENVVRDRVNCPILHMILSNNDIEFWLNDHRLRQMSISKFMDTMDTEIEWLAQWFPNTIWFEGMLIKKDDAGEMIYQSINGITTRSE